MELWFIITMIIVAAVWGISIFYRSRFLLHMMQLEGYNNDNYLGWLARNREKVYPKKLGWTINILAVITIFLGAIVSDKVIYIYSVIWIGAMLYTVNFKDEQSKIELVYTDRAKRLFATNAVISVAFLALALTIYILFIPEPMTLMPVILLLGTLIYYMNAYTLILANIVIRPVEEGINKKFFDMAKSKIKNTKGLNVVGITGSYGKTSVKFITATILEEKLNTLKTPESYNTPMGVSKTVNQELNDDYETFIVEMGARNIGDIKEMSDLASPKIGVLTSIGPTHLETFINIENIMNTKYELIESLPSDGTAIFNYDNKYVKKLADKTSKDKILYGIKNIKQVDIYATDVKVSEKGSTFTLGYKTGEEKQVTTKLLGEHNISNILAGVAVAKALGLTIEEIASRISIIEPIPHRLQLITPPTGVTIIDNAFNSNPVSSKAALDVLGKFKEGRKIIITPGMIELGEDEAKENEIFGKNIAKVCDFAILVGPKRTEPIQLGLKKMNFKEENIFVVATLDIATQVLGKLTKPKDVVLFENDLPDNYNE